MALDGLFLHLLINELDEKLIGSRVDKIHQPGRTELIFTMRTREGMYKLLLSANAESARLGITKASPDNPASPPMLCMLLRKRLTGASLTAITQDGLDRTVFLEFSAVNEIGDREKLTLAVEIMAQNSNIILLDADGVIIDAVRRVDSERSSYREVLPGREYVYPPVQNKLNLLTDSADAFQCALSSFSDNTVSSALLKTFSGFSPLTCRELAARSGCEDGALKLLSAGELASLTDELLKLKSYVNGNKSEPTAICRDGGKPFEFSFRPVTQYGSLLSEEHFDSLSELLDGFYSELDRYKRTRSRCTELFKLVEGLTERTARRINAQRAELEQSRDREKLRIYGELITADRYALDKGCTCYTVNNYYDDNNELSIPADPALTPIQNAQKYYKEYRKAATAEQKLASLILEGELELEYLKSVYDALSRAGTEQEISEIRAELTAGGYIRRKSKQKPGEKIKDSKPIAYLTSDGCTVLVGRNNIGNDRLSFHTADKNDMWFHVKKSPGSHTVLVLDGKEPTDTAVLEAAAIAAKHSSLCADELVSVDYTYVKNLKKPPASRPGYVIYNTYWSVNVRPMA